MKKNLAFDFLVDKENNTVTVIREFGAPGDIVWSAWTEPQLLDQWWAPEPWKSRTKSMDFRAGGRRLYAMVGPEGEEHWALADYTSVTPKSNFKHLDAFCDSEGKINEDFPRSDWNVDFTDQNNFTVVNVIIKHKTFADLEKNMELGFKEGFTTALNGLDKLLNK